MDSRWEDTDLFPCLTEDTCPVALQGRTSNAQVKKEFLELYIRYAPLWEKEEGERCQRWSGLLETFAEEGRPQNLER